MNTKNGPITFTLPTKFIISFAADEFIEIFASSGIKIDNLFLGKALIYIKNPLHMGRNRIMRKGYVGKVEFKTPVPNNILLQILDVIGMGKFYGIGGGQIKLCMN